MGNMPPLNRVVRAILVCLISVDLLVVSADLLREGRVDFLTLGNAVAMVGVCALVWIGLAWGRWLLLGLIAWRAIFIGTAVVSSLGPGEVLRPGASLVLLVYAGAAVVLVFSLVRPNRRRAN
jgi:hypothetical protein